MSKWIIELSKEETNLRKKTEMEHETTSEQIAEKHPTINIDGHEIETFLLIFHILLESNTDLTKKEETDNTDGVPDIIITITNKLIKHLQDNIDSLNIADILEKTLKKIKSLIIKQEKGGKNKNNSKNSIRSEMTCSTKDSSTT